MIGLKTKGPNGYRPTRGTISSQMYTHSNSRNGVHLSSNDFKRSNSPSLPPLSMSTGSLPSTLPPTTTTSSSICADQSNQPLDNTPEENYNIGMKLLSGDPAKALEFFRAAAENQHLDSMYQYAYLLAQDHSSKCTALRIMKTSAQLGQKDAISMYGKMVEKGIGCTANREEAYVIYQKGIKNGDGRSMYYCAMLLKEARRDPKQMYCLFKEAADLNIPGAFNELAICLRDGIGVEKNPVCAASMFKQLADSDDQSGMYQYAVCLKNGIGVQKNVAMFRQIIEKGLSSNSVEFRLLYARCIEIGDGYDKDLKKAEMIYKELADNGNPFAQNDYASFLQKQNNYNEALKYYQMAAAQHHPTAPCSLARLQIQIPSLRTEGMKNLKKIADSGNGIAQFSYAVCLKEEKGSDPNEVIKYFKLASDSGMSNATYNYALELMKSGSREESIALLKSAADKGNMKSMYSYAQAIKKENIEEATQYFEMAANHGSSRSKYELAMIKFELKDQDMGMQLLKEAADSGCQKAKAKYDKKTSSIPGMGPNEKNPDKAYEYIRHIPDLPTALSFFDKYHDPKSQISCLRRAQILLKDPTDEKTIKTAVSTISELAKGGLTEAKYVYATILEEGKLVKKNMLEARKYYQEASKAQYPLAMSAYGRILKVEDQALACRLFKEAADKNLPIAQYQYARILEIGGAEEEALRYYKMASDNGIAKAQFRYGRMHEICSKIKRSYEIAVQYYKLAARRKYPKAMNNYGHMLEQGLGVEKNTKLASFYYKKASELGNTFATHNYARVLEHGIGVEKNELAAAQIYKKLAEDENNGLAQYNYGRMCHNGIGVREDLEAAQKYYLMAIDNNIAEAKQNYGVLLFTKFHKWNEAARFFEMAVSGNGGQPSAKYNYAQLLIQGMGTPENPKLAEQLLKEAATSFLPAMVSYAQLLAEKENDSDLKEAAIYFKKAADMDDSERKFLKPQRDAQYRLALMYRDGNGVEKNEELFNKYIVMAANNKHPDAEDIVYPPQCELKLTL